MSPLIWRGATHTSAGPSGTAGDDETTLDLVEESLMQLTVSIPYTKDEDIPIWMCRHTSGGRCRFTRLFRKITSVVA